MSDKERKNNKVRFIGGFLGLLTAVSILALSETAAQRVAFVSACAVFPQGSTVLLRKIKEEKEPVPTETEKTAPVSGTVLTEIPDDIKALIEEAERESVNDKKDGDIKEFTFGRKSSNREIGNILIKDSTEETADFTELLEKPLDLEIDKEKPAVLIFHTHTTEGYEMLDRDFYACDKTSRTDDSSRNIVRVGEEVASALEDKGFVVIHDKTVHDFRYSGSYDRSRETVRQHLEKNPQIKVVLDIHRDAIQENDGTKIKAVKEINGRKAAQIMIISGAEGGGKVSDFPFWRDNLSFALKLHSACEMNSDGIMRPLMFCYRKYNMDETPCSLLVEFGSEANTLSEAVYSARLFGNALAELLNEYEKEQK